MLEEGLENFSAQTGIPQKANEEKNTKLVCYSMQGLLVDFLSSVLQTYLKLEDSRSIEVSCLFCMLYIATILVYLTCQGSAWTY